MIDSTTGMGLGGRSFATTQWSIIRDAQGPAVSPEAMEQLARIYWPPVYAYLRRKWGCANDEAKDLTQEFFLSLVEKDFLADLSPRLGKFRSYVMVALDNIVRLRHRHQSTLKRGGGVPHFSIDGAKVIDLPAGATPDQVFRQAWASAILGEALGRMKRDYESAGKEAIFEMFMLHDVHPPAAGELGYEELARRFRRTVTEITNDLHRARTKLREIVLVLVRETVSTEREAAEEIRELFGSMLK